jgi:hypothetical protein
MNLITFGNRLAGLARFYQKGIVLEIKPVFDLGEPELVPTIGLHKYKISIKFCIKKCDR